MELRSQWSGVLTESGIITAKSAKLVGWTARCSADSVIQIYRGTDVGADADIVTELDVLAADKSAGVMSINADSQRGFYLKITGSARVIVYFRDNVVSTWDR